MPTSKTIAIFSGLALAAFCAVRLMPAQSLNSAVQIPDTVAPNAAPQFSAYEFGFAELEPTEGGRVFFKRAAFKPIQKMRTESVTTYRTETRTQTVTDSSGQQREQAYLEQVPVQETREVAYTCNELDGKQTLACPFDSLKVVNLQGEQLEVGQARLALSSRRRVIIQMFGSKEDAYYNSFLHPDTLFVQSDKWVDASVAPLKTEQDRNVTNGATTDPEARDLDFTPPDSQRSRQEGLEALSADLDAMLEKLGVGKN